VELTQQDVAAALSVSTMSVERAMRVLRETGLVQTGYGHVTVYEKTHFSAA